MNQTALTVLFVVLTAGCLGGGPSSDVQTATPTDSGEQFLEEGETPESSSAREFLVTVAEVTGGRTGFQGKDDTWRIKFSEAGNAWKIRYYANALSGEQFREELTELSTAFVEHRPEGVSLEVTVLHECTTGTWEVSADTAAAYERENLSREEFLKNVYESVETENNC